MREHLRSVKNSFRHRGESGFFGNPVIERLRTRCAPREGAGRPLVDGGEIPEQPPRPRETRNGGRLCGAVLVLCVMSSPRYLYFQILHRAAFVARSSVLGMLSSSISAFQRAYYHLLSRPGWRERAPGLSLCNLGVGAESARCVLVKLLLHFGTPKLTVGTPLAFLEAENIRFFIRGFVYDFCMR